MTIPGVGIVAWGAVTTAGVGTPALAEALSNPSWRPEPGLERPDGHPLPVVTCREFNPRDHLPPLVARRLDRPARLLAVAAREAMAAGGDPLPWARTHVGVSVGTFNAGTEALLEVLKEVFLGNPDEAPPAQFPSTVANAAASQLGILEKLTGPNLTFAEKQASGMRAIIEAARLLSSGRATAMVAGGVDEAQWLHAECLDRLGALGDGSGGAPLWGEGAAALLLARDNVVPAKVVLAGWGQASYPADPCRYPESPAPLVGAIGGALNRAGVDATSIDLVVSLADGAPRLAALEQSALLHVFASTRPAAVAVSDRLGEGAFASALRVVVAGLAVSGECLPAWEPPPHLADSGFRTLAATPETALVTAMAGGGSAIAVVLRHP